MMENHDNWAYGLGFGSKKLKCQICGKATFDFIIDMKNNNAKIGCCSECSDELEERLQREYGKKRHEGR